VSHCSCNVSETLDVDLLHSCWPKILGKLLYTYLHPPTGADEVTGESWQLVTAIHDESNGLILCEFTNRVITAFILVMLALVSGTDPMVIFNIILCSFLYNLIEI
jgi:hypothetical protein